MTRVGGTASYNVLVKRDGTAVMLVDPNDAAWSHGKINKPNWPLLKSGVNPNLYTLSICRVGSDQRKWDPPQMDTIVRIIKLWANEFDFPAKWPNVFGHKHIDGVDRWYCPGNPFLNELYVRLAVPDIEPKPVEDDEWFRVVAGSYKDEQNAQMVAANLRRMGVTGVFVDRVKITR